ncbi:MAG TPA: hypothetical protein VG186_05700 [Solirubrobacteraceae bacterium]|nr:hypothetical protein [Solirubrobacteraceae bacterium]
MPETQSKSAVEENPVRRGAALPVREVFTAAVDRELHQALAVGGGFSDIVGAGGRFSQITVRPTEV